MMPFAALSLSEFLYNGRYHLLALVLFAWVAYAVVREVIADRAERRAHGQAPAAAGVGVFHDPLLGATMADGGHPEGNDDPAPRA